MQHYECIVASINACGKISTNAKNDDEAENDDDNNNDDDYGDDSDDARINLLS